MARDWFHPKGWSGYGLLPNDLNSIRESECPIVSATDTGVPIKVEFEGRLIGVDLWSAPYNSIYIHCFVTREGDVILAKQTARLRMPQSRQRVVPGDFVKVVGSVDAGGEYDGIPWIRLKRSRVLEVLEKQEDYGSDVGDPSDEDSSEIRKRDRVETRSEHQWLGATNTDKPIRASIDDDNRVRRGGGAPAPWRELTDRAKCVMDNEAAVADEKKVKNREAAEQEAKARQDSLRKKAQERKEARDSLREVEPDRSTADELWEQCFG